MGIKVGRRVKSSGRLRRAKAAREGLGLTPMFQSCSPDETFCKFSPYLTVLEDCNFQFKRLAAKHSFSLAAMC
jgi:hypothetical protein